MKNYFLKIKNIFSKIINFISEWWGWFIIAPFGILFLAIVFQVYFSKYGHKASSIENIVHALGVFIGILCLLGMIILLHLFVAHIYYLTVHRLFFSKLNIGKFVAFLLCVFTTVFTITTTYNDKYPQDTEKTLVITVVQLAYLLLFIGYSFIKDSYKKQKEQAKLLQQKTEAELTSLKAQVNPHFLFNSLNNIYGTAMTEAAPRTANSLQQLSGIMRYVLEKSSMEKVSIADEIKFLNDYTYMHELRIPKRENIEIDIKIDWDEQPADIVPLLLNPIIENTFKYGVSIDHACFVKIRFEVTQGKLYFAAQNSILPNNSLEQGTGQGLENVRQRLELAYPNKHSFEISEIDGVFGVMLEIELK